MWAMTLLALDRVALDELGHRARARAVVVDEMAQAAVFEEGDAEAVLVFLRAVARPVKLNITSVGVLAFMPSSWHIVACRSGLLEEQARRAAPAEQVAGVAGFFQHARQRRRMDGLRCDRQITRSVIQGCRLTRLAFS
jgi:hypothetical protein